MENIEIPNKNGTFIKYITSTCRYEEIESNNCKTITLCNNDSECLSNKCFNNYCVFNKETPIVHYILICIVEKPYNDECNSNDECSSKQCMSGTCEMQYDGSFDSESTGYHEMMEKLRLGLVLDEGCYSNSYNS